jgi:hypothetical protein
MLLVEGILVGLLASLLSGGRFRCASHNEIRLDYLLAGGLAVQLAWPRIAGWLGVGVAEFLVVWLLVALLVLGVTIVNARVPGMLLVTIGLLLNMTVILANGGMPVDVSRAAIGAEVAAAALGESPLHVAADPATVALPLGDIIYVPGPSWHRGLVSVGDVLMAAGAGIVAFWAIRCRSSRGRDGYAPEG